MKPFKLILIATTFSCQINIYVKWIKAPPDMNGITLVHFSWAVSKWRVCQVTFFFHSLSHHFPSGVHQSNCTWSVLMCFGDLKTCQGTTYPRPQDPLGYTKFIQLELHHVRQEKGKWLFSTQYIKRHALIAGQFLHILRRTGVADRLHYNGKSLQEGF